jgi:CRISPR/Cas system endoribonuclease Cas6 (RAMP superfamily)
LVTKANACDRHLERAHADAGRLNGQIIVAGFEEIQSNAAFRVDRVGCRDRVESAAQTPHGITEEKIYLASVLKGIAQVRAFDPVSGDGLAERQTMQLLVLFSKELFNLDG